MEERIDIPVRLLLLTAVSVLVAGCSDRQGSHVNKLKLAMSKRVRAAATLPEERICKPDPGPQKGTKRQYPVPTPPFSKGVWPCAECHADMEANLKRRDLKDSHPKIKLAHGPRERWCFDCHDPKDRNKLRLASGKLVPFKESYRLCGQCHGPKLRDWRVGVHGARTGWWYGKKFYLLCAHCHDPHAPRFKPIEPLPPPRRPGELH
jgi:hypothetical protein